jgi:hypothetical protein
MSEQRAREEFALLMLIGPRALDVEKFEAGDKFCERERVDRELRDRPIGPRLY